MRKVMAFYHTVGGVALSLVDFVYYLEVTVLCKTVPVVS